MAEFTLPPGPWETDPHGTGEHGSVYDANGEQLLQTQPSSVHASGRSEQLAYRKELARRLTAYPDLYEALKDLRACIMEVRGPCSHVAVIAADKALKKAGD